MAVPPVAEKKRSILFLMDDRLSREKISILRRVTALLREIYAIEVLSDPISETDLVKKLETTRPYDLVLAPWHRYSIWNRVETFFGASRLSGATFAGYFAENLKYTELGARSDQARSIILDFANTTPPEIAVMIRSLVEDTSRMGLKPILEKDTPVYCDTWASPVEFGRKLDALFNVPELYAGDWGKRATALRILFQAFWGISFGETIAHQDRIAAEKSARPAKSYFQIGIDSGIFAMRLVCPNIRKTPRELLQAFWPNPADAFSAPQLILKYSDWVRVHAFAESSEMEITVALLKSAPSEAAHGSFQSLWIEPISAKILNELPFEMPNARSPHLRDIPSAASPPAPASPTPSLPLAPPPPQASAKATPPPDPTNRLVLQAANKIKELTQLLVSRDELIQELRSGGVGTAEPLPPPDAEALIEAFQQKYFETRYQIRQFEVQVAALEKKSDNLKEIEILRLKIAQLHAQETAWIKKLATTIEMYREAKKKA